MHIHLTAAVSNQQTAQKEYSSHIRQQHTISLYVKYVTTARLTTTETALWTITTDSSANDYYRDSSAN